MTGDLDGRVALITGAGRGIGAEIAAGLASRGARVAMLARTASQLDQVAATVIAAGGTALALTADLGDEGQTVAALRRARSELGEIELLINNAAVVGPLAPTSALTRREIADALAVNVLAPIYLSGRVLPAMLDEGWGRIVNVSSGVASRPEMMIRGTVYATSKAALEAHTLNLSAELAGTGVTVNVYRPGAVDTEMQAWIRGQDPDRIGSELHQRFMQSHAAGTLLTPQQSAAALLAHLDSDATGQIWEASGAPTSPQT
ncbi:MAG TPA: SDR family oxidoreductase [Solirubrobacteraceae bacterium]|nr:SDR family oxidoreductase [Solirubrobacteraceae bacterium]